MAAQAGLDVAMPMSPSLPRPTVAVVMTSPAYPYGNTAPEQRGRLPRALFANPDDDLAIFGAAIQAGDTTHLSTGDGRVLSVVAAADTLAAARLRVYQQVADIKACWPAAHFRDDIAIGVG